MSRRTRTLKRWVMSPARRKIFMVASNARKPRFLAAYLVGSGKDW